MDIVLSALDLRLYFVYLSSEYTNVKFLGIWRTIHHLLLCFSVRRQIGVVIQIKIKLQV